MEKDGPVPILLLSVSFSHSLFAIPALKCAQVEIRVGEIIEHASLGVERKLKVNYADKLKL